MFPEEGEVEVLSVSFSYKYCPVKKNFTHHYKHKRVLASRNENLLVSKMLWKKRQDTIFEFCIFDLDELPLADQKLSKIETP